jgi:hypothetical protein
VTRRGFIIGASSAVIAAGQEIASAEKDTWITLIDAKPEPGFMIGVRTSIKADRALVTVFYEGLAALKAGDEPVKLLLSMESTAPVAGVEGYGGTRDVFKMPRESVKFVKVLLLNEVAERKLSL